MDTKRPPNPKYTGNFDLYSMSLPFLKEPYLSKGDGKPQYEEVRKVILEKQAKNDKTARCYLDSEDGDESRFESRVIQDPMEEMPFDIAINSMKLQKHLSFTKTELNSFAAPGFIPDGPGITAVTALADDDHCGIQSASGVFKMKRVWTKLNPGGELVELFEGFMSFNVSHSGIYRKKGHGNGEKTKFAFWGVRARVQDGKEVGLRPMVPVSVSDSSDDMEEDSEAESTASETAIQKVCVSLQY